MTAKISASLDGTKVNIGTAAEDALQIDATAKTIKPVSPYVMSGNGPAFMARKTGSSQSVSIGTYTKVTLNTEEFDTANAFSTATSRFQPLVAGYYQINGAVYGGGSSVGAVEADIYKNGVMHVGASVASATPQVVSVSGLVYLNGTTDYVELYAWVSAASGANVDVNYTQMSGFLARTA